MLKKYHVLLLVSVLVITLYSCEKGDVPMPVFDQSEIVTGDDGVTVKDGDSNDKGFGDIVGGDDNEDDDGGGVVVGGGSDGSSDGSSGDGRGANGGGSIIGGGDVDSDPISG